MVCKYILPASGHLTVDAIAVEHVRDWFASMADRPGSANRARPVLSVMMSMAELWGYRPHNSNPCKNTRRYRTEPKERFLTAKELARLNAVLNRDAFWCPHIVAIVRLLMLTGCRLGEIVSLEWDWIRGKRIHLPDPKSGPRTVWLSSAAQVFPEDLTSARLYTFWVGIREEAGLAELGIHDARHTYASQRLMNGVGLDTVSIGFQYSTPINTQASITISHGGCLARNDRSAKVSSGRPESLRPYCRAIENSSWKYRCR